MAEFIQKVLGVSSAGQNTNENELKTSKKSPKNRPLPTYSSTFNSQFSYKKISQKGSLVTKQNKLLNQIKKLAYSPIEEDLEREDEEENKIGANFDNQEFLARNSEEIIELQQQQTEEIWEEFDHKIKKRKKKKRFKIKFKSFKKLRVEALLRFLRRTILKTRSSDESDCLVGEYQNTDSRIYGISYRTKRKRKSPKISLPKYKRRRTKIARRKIRKGLKQGCQYLGVGVSSFVGYFPDLYFPGLFTTGNYVRQSGDHLYHLPDFPMFTAVRY